MKTLYTTSEKDKIKEVFEEPNQMVIIYKNDLEKNIANKCLDVEKLDKVDSVLCYGNTINQPLTYQKLKDKLKDFGMSFDVDDYLLKILYYSYHNKKENKIEMEDLVYFLKNKAKENNLTNIDDSSLNKLENFTTIKGVTQKRSLSDLSSLLGIDEDSLKNLMILYNTKNVNTKISILDFITFLKKDVLTNSTFSSKIPSNTINSINTLEKFTSKSTINSKLSYSKMANLFGMNEEIMSQLYLYYYSIKGVDTKLSLYDFSNFVIHNELINTTYSNLISKENKEQLKMLMTFSDKKIINQNMSSDSLSKTFGLDKDSVDKLLLLYYGSMESDTTMTLKEFIEKVIYLKQTTSYLDTSKDLDVDKLKLLLEKEEMAEIFNSNFLTKDTYQDWIDYYKSREIIGDKDYIISNYLENDKKRLLIK